MKTRMQRLSGMVAFAVSALVMLALSLSQPAEVRAQWTTPDASQNINNTNTGNVGIGTTVPAYKLDLANAMDKAQIRFGIGTSDTGGYLFSSGPSHATLSAGASWNGGWIARSLSASFFEANMGSLMFYANSGISTGSPFTPTERMRITSNGYVGIGATLPSHKLHVRSGTDSATTLLFLDTGTHGGTALAVSGNVNNESGFDMSVYRAGQYFSRFGVNNFGNVYMQPAGGNVGFGTASPNALLDLASTTQLSNRIRLSGQEYYQPGNTSTAGVDIRLGTNRTSERQIWFADSANAINATTAQLRMRFQGTYATLDSISTDGTTTLPMALNATGGNVGIGTTTPGYKLDVAGQVRSSSGGFVFPNGSIQTTAYTGGTAITAVNAGLGLTGGGTSGSLTLDVGAGTGLNVTADSISVNYGSAAGTAVQGNTSITVSPGPGMSGGGSITLGSGGSLTLTNSDRGSAQPIFKNIANSLGVTQFSAAVDDTLRFEGTGGTIVSFTPGTKKITIDGGGSSGWTDGGANVSLATSSDNVGIGTSTPTTKLQVAGGTRVDGTSGRIYLGTGAAVGSRGLEIIEANATTISIQHHDPNVAWRNIAINPNVGGNVGIGNLAPNSQYKLDVTGDTNVTGNLIATGTITGGTINAKYQDVAEWVPSTQELSAGTVVVLDHERSNHVVASSQIYDTRVAGVVSAQPGVILGEGGAGKVMVATTGRVRVKVDATRSPIKVGDLLVTGDGEGLAMKSTPIDLSGTLFHRPGTIIGKALEPWEKGTGAILVLLSLQ